MRTDLDYGSDQSFWPVIGDIMVAMLLILVLFLVVQFIKFNKLRQYEIVAERQTEVEEALRSRFGESIDVQRADDLHQRLTFSSDALFATCESDLKPQGGELMSGVGDVLEGFEDYFVTVQVEGHTDSRSTNTGTCRFPSNWELSSARATSVVRILTDTTRAAVDPRLVSSVGRGQFQPVTAGFGDSEEEWRRNRRIEILLQYELDDVL